jgi:hypothetical protein
MAKKKSAVFTASITLNPEKAGAWLAYYNLTTFETSSAGLNSLPDQEGKGAQTAWKNASAAKRWIKEMVLQNTTRKSVKMNPTKFNEAEKPTAFEGRLEFKVDA